VDAWLAEWGGKAQKAYDTLSKKLSELINHPNTAAEEKERKQLVKEIKAQTRDVLARADKAALRMQESEAEQVRFYSEQIKLSLSYFSNLHF
jgi:hypothetical protein